MSVKTRTQGKSEANTNIPDNTNKEISAVDVRGNIIDLWDSAVSKKGDSGIQGILSYGSNFTFINDTDLVSKKYVDDAIDGSTAGVIYADGTVSFIANQSLGGFSLINVDSITDTSNVSLINTDQRFLLDSNGLVIAKFLDIYEGFAVSTNSYFGHFKTDLLSDDEVFQLPPDSGTLALTSDLPDTDLLDPATPISDGKYRFEQAFEGVKSWGINHDAFGTSIDVVEKLQAEGVGDWDSNGVYVGVTSGAIVIGTDCQPGETFPGIGDVSMSNYIYYCFPDGWRRTATAL